MWLRRRLTVMFALVAFMPVALANPEGGVVVGGSAQITQPSESTVHINQTSDKAIINWQTFNIHEGQTTQFNQPSASSITLNRINGLNGPSNIFGNLIANGQVWLLNSSGIMFGKNAQVNVGGLLATTSNISNQDFMSGNYNFTASTNETGTIINNGHIQAGPNGLVGLIGNGVENNGVIRAQLGTVILAGAQAYTLDFDGDQLINFTIKQGPSGKAMGNNGKPLDIAVSNSGIVDVGSSAMMTTRAARSLVTSVINMAGKQEANHVSVQNGVIVLAAGGGGRVRVGGRVLA